jgi:hypothetical protein
MKPELKKIAWRFLVLSMLMGCLALFTPSRTASAYYHCDVQYASCMQWCGQPIDQICAYDCGIQRADCENGPPWID